MDNSIYPNRGPAGGTFKPSSPRNQQTLFTNDSPSQYLPQGYTVKNYGSNQLQSMLPNHTIVQQVLVQDNPPMQQHFPSPQNLLSSPTGYIQKIDPVYDYSFQPQNYGPSTLAVAAKQIIVDNRDQKISQLQKINFDLLTELNNLRTAAQNPQIVEQTKFIQDHTRVMQLETKVQFLNEELDRLNRTDKDRIIEIQRLRTAIQGNDYRVENYPVLETRVQSLKEEIQRLNISNYEKMDEIDRLRANISRTENKARDLAHLSEQLDKYRNALDQKNRELENYRFNSQRNTSNYSNSNPSEVIELKHQLEQLDQDLDTVTNENQRLAAALRQKLDENENLKNERTKSQSQYGSNLGQEDEISRLKGVINQKNRELDDLRLKQYDFPQNNSSLASNENKDDQIGYLSNEVDKLQRVIASKNDEIDRLRFGQLGGTTVSNYISDGNSSNDIRITLLEQDNQRLLDIINQRDREIEELMRKNQVAIDNRTLENRVATLNEELVRANVTIQQKIQEIENLRSKLFAYENQDYKNILNDDRQFSDTVTNSKFGGLNSIEPLDIFKQQPLPLQSSSNYTPFVSSELPLLKNPDFQSNNAISAIPISNILDDQLLKDPLYGQNSLIDNLPFKHTPSNSNIPSGKILDTLSNEQIPSSAVRNILEQQQQKKNNPLSSNLFKN